MEKIKERALERRQELFHSNSILVGFRGSVAHNTYLPNTDPNSVDDIDLMGVYLMPPKYYIGIKSEGKGVKGGFVDEWDVVSYEFRKFVRLLLKCNPNVMSMLWMDDPYYLKKTKYGRILIENRDLFSSKIAYDSYTGYANGQIKKMSAFAKEGYMGEKRKSLVEKFGFDCANASHAIRLLRQGITFLREGKIEVHRRRDAEELLLIKTGAWSLEKVKMEAEMLFTIAKVAYEESELPDKPNYEAVDELVYKIMYDYLYNG
jgi:hypothetical protein